MSRPVNVLQVMLDGASDYDESGHDGLADDMREAHSAVADLLDMAELVDALLSTRRIELSRGDGLTLTAARRRVAGLRY